MNKESQQSNHLRTDVNWHSDIMRAQGKYNFFGVFDTQQFIASWIQFKAAVRVSAYQINSKLQLSSKKHANSATRYILKIRQQENIVDIFKCKT